MVRRAFFSFHYKPDNWRASQVRNIGMVEGNSPVSDNEWEQITGGGEKRIKAWIDDQMKNRSCVIVLVGTNTAGRKYINYEIEHGWNSGKGLVGIYIHNLKNKDGDQCAKGRNPFEGFKAGDKKLSSIVKLYDPPYKTSTNAYSYIEDNIESWVEEAIKIRNNT